MVHKLILLISLLVSVVYSKEAKKNLVFVFEVARHGARAPLLPEYAKGFSVGAEMLTPSGMRQQYLLGKFYRKKYIEDMGFLSDHYVQDEIFVASTYVARTIESARARMFGLYPQKATNNKLSEEEAKSTFPPIKISEDIDRSSLDAIPSKYQPVAVMNNDLKHDTIFATGNCPYLLNQHNERRADKSLWKSFDDYFKPRIYKKIAEVLELDDSESIDYVKAYYLGDAIQAMEFEGLLDRGEFTDEEWSDIERLQIPASITSLSPLGTRLLISKLINPVLSLMFFRLGKEFNKNLIGPYKGTEKYVLYAAHDDTMASFLSFLMLEDTVPETIKYASNLIFEFYEYEDKDETKQ